MAIYLSITERFLCCLDNGFNSIDSVLIDAYVMKPILDEQSDI